MTAGLLLHRPALRLALILTCFGALQPAFGNKLAALFTLALVAATLYPAQRRSILSSLAILVCVYSNSPSLRGDPAVNLLAIAGLSCGAVWIAALLLWTRFHADLPRTIARHSVGLLHLGCACAIALLCLAGREGWITTLTAGALCTLAPELVWRSSYWLKWRARQGATAPIWPNLFAALPFMSAGGVPIGKGPTYLAQHEAAGPDQLAAAQIEGARLLVLSLLWRMTDSVLGTVLWTPQTWLAPTPLLPSMQALLSAPASYTLFERWAGLFAELAHTILGLAIFGHLAVGILCLAGFRVPRNTAAPLLATTILDFWNRYYFYFKELLIDFFFFPTFLRAEGTAVLARTWIAVIAAAFFGNVYFHILLYASKLAAGEVSAFLSLLSARLVYCAFLATALCWSFARTLRKPAQSPSIRLPRRLLRMAGVTLFFALIHVWNFGEADISLVQRLEFWRSLVWN